MVERHRKFGEGRVPEIEGYIKGSVSYCLDFFSDVPTLTVIDVGANYGYALQLFAEQGWDGWGIDINPQHLLEGVTVLKGEMEALIYQPPLTPAPSLFFFNHTLEHSKRSWEVLEAVHRLLPTGGGLFLAVPHPDSEDYISSGHCAIFTAPFLKAMLTRIGFSEVEVDTVQYRQGRPELYARARKRDCW